MRKLLPLAGVLALALLLLLPLVLHFGQKAHNRLDIAPIPNDPGYVPGMNFGSAAARVMEHELEGTTGWRPNDLVIWGPSVTADNNANRQLGILQALRETTRVFKDDLTKVSNDVYDRNLVEADNLLRNDPYKWAFPSAESRYREAVERLDAYVAGLRDGRSRPVNTRNTELRNLLGTWTDLLGDAHAELYGTQVGWFAVDDVFYRATGYCHVIAKMLPAVEIEYRAELSARAGLKTMFDEIHAPLARCAVIKPIYVFNGRDSGPLANQRRNLDAYVNEVRQKLYLIRDELEK
ncbi:MAG: DUF2333 family protein [Thermodesulfobacteriota bacterium]